MVDQIWTLVHAERAALISDLEGLAAPRWEEASLCDGWSVHDVVAHLIDTARTTRVGFVLGLARARMDFDRQNERGVRRHRGASPQQTLQRLRDVAGRTSTPPAALESRLVEEVVHGEDIRRPLGIVRSYPPEAVVPGLMYQTRTPSRSVSVPRSRGPSLALLLLACGRAVARPDLTGPGLQHV